MDVDLFQNKRSRILEVHTAIRAVNLLDAEGRFLDGGLRPGAARSERVEVTLRQFATQARLFELARTGLHGSVHGPPRWIVLRQEGSGVGIFALGASIVSVAFDEYLPMNYLDAIADVLEEGPPIAKIQ